MDNNVKFIKQKDGSFKLVVCMLEEEYLQLNEVLSTINMSFQEIMDLFFSELIRTQKLPIERN